MLTELKNIGLSDKEARVYLAMLELGPATMLDIAAKAGVNRPTAYVQIEMLKKKGLASTQTKGKKHLFIAESPSQFMHLLEDEQKKVEHKLSDLKKVLPDLTTIFNLGEEKPVVRYFEGREGLLAMQREFLKIKGGKEIMGIFDVDGVLEIFPAHLESYTSQRMKKKIKSRVIYTSRRGPILKSSDSKKMRISKYLPPEKLSFTSDITIFDNHVAISSLKGKIGGTIITDKEISNSFRTIFELIWKII